MSAASRSRVPIVFPAVDIRGGRCVRLLRGARDAEIPYGDDPVRVARRWVEEGARVLHVVDLGAALGEPDSGPAIAEIARSAGVPIQCGGGIRDARRLAEILEAGVARAILGTRALRDPEFLAEAVARHGAARVGVCLVFDGARLEIGGGGASAPRGAREAIEQVEAAGVRRFLVTATDRDGTLSGPRLDLVVRVLEAGRSRVVAAGGIGSVEDVRAVLALGHPRLEGVVLGRALYEGRVSLREALACAREFEREEETR
ncbi:MAG: 1-(5-phosphoribosyl)-5-[(5-phosphoribosylamino)methylideneamino] imidazole-4-carboxamide isomerase [Planctomycetota bacterium]